MDKKYSFIDYSIIEYFDNKIKKELFNLGIESINKNISIIDYELNHNCNIKKIYESIHILKGLGSIGAKDIYLNAHNSILLLKLNNKLLLKNEINFELFIKKINILKKSCKQFVKWIFKLKL